MGWESDNPSTASQALYVFQSKEAAVFLGQVAPMSVYYLFIRFDHCPHSVLYSHVRNLELCEPLRIQRSIDLGLFVFHSEAKGD